MSLRIDFRNNSISATLNAEYNLYFIENVCIKIAN